MNSSRFISSAQQDIHDQLRDLIHKHCASPFKKPITLYNQQAFESSINCWQQAGSKPLILDTGCGVGLSTRYLAQQYPDHFVIGIDQSEDRLTRNTHWEGDIPDNMTFIRADLVDYWRLLYQANIHPARHYLLYPNPWPKVGHIARRWQGHPVFPYIVALGGYIECRSNWSIYVKEFAAAITQIAQVPVNVEHYQPTFFMTPFEKKYTLSGHELWRCTVSLNPGKLALDQ